MTTDNPSAALRVAVRELLDAQDAMDAAASAHLAALSAKRSTATEKDAAGKALSVARRRVKTSWDDLRSALGEEPSTPVPAEGTVRSMLTDALRRYDAATPEEQAEISALALAECAAPLADVETCAREVLRIAERTDFGTARGDRDCTLCMGRSDLQPCEECAPGAACAALGAELARAVLAGSTPRCRELPTSEQVSRLESMAQTAEREVESRRASIAELAPGCDRRAAEVRAMLARESDAKALRAALRAVRSVGPDASAGGAGAPPGCAPAGAGLFAIEDPVALIEALGPAVDAGLSRVRDADEERSEAGWSGRLTCPACPVQIEGEVDGRAFYFRARWSAWSFGVSADVLGADSDLSFEEAHARADSTRYPRVQAVVAPEFSAEGEADGDGSWMPYSEAWRHVEASIAAFRARRAGAAPAEST